MYSLSKRLFVLNTIGNVLMGVLIVASVYLLLSKLGILKIFKILSPFFWILTFYFSMVFYYLWYQEDRNSRHNIYSKDLLEKVVRYKMEYRLKGAIFGILLFISLLFNNI